MNAHFRVAGRLHMASKIIGGTVTVFRGPGLFEVRPLRSRKTFTLPLSEVATMVCQRLSRAEEFQKRLTKAARRKR